MITDRLRPVFFPSAFLCASLLVCAPKPAHAGQFGLSIGGRSGALGISIHGGSFGVSYRSGSPGYRASVRYAPHAPRYEHPAACLPRRVWTPGHYDTVERRVWVPGHEDRVWVEPVYETRYDAYGRSCEVLVRAGYWKTVRSPGHYETRRDEVWVPGGWEPVYEPSRYPPVRPRYGGSWR